MSVAGGTNELDKFFDFSEMKPRSRASVKLALQTHQLDNIPGTLIIEIPAMAGKPIECYFTNMPSEYHSKLTRA